MNVQNKQFYDASKALTKVILETLARQEAPNSYLLSENVWRKQGDISYIKQQINRPVWSMILHKAENEFTKTKEYDDFLEAINSDDKISRHIDTQVGTRLGSFRMEAKNFAILPAYEFLTDDGVKAFNRDSFDHFFFGMEKDILSDEVEYEGLTPLCGLKMDDTELPLDAGTSIIRLGEKDILDFFNFGIKLGSSMGGYDHVHDVHEYAIKTSYKLPKTIGGQPKLIDEDDKFLNNKIEQSIIDAFRIFKKGKLYPITTMKRGKGIFAMGTSYSFEKPVGHFMENKYMLSSDEAKEFSSFWKEKSGANLPEKNFISVAIRRFSQANERDNDEDKIIDLMISAEALFLSSSGSFSGELKYRLSHRAAMYIENEVKRQKYVFNFMQKAYDVRSSIVHGSDPTLPKKADDTQYESLKDFCDDIEQYLRISIKKVISSDQVSKSIDWNSIIFSEIS